MLNRKKLNSMREALWSHIEAMRPESAYEQEERNRAIRRAMNLEFLSALWEIRDELRRNVNDVLGTGDLGADEELASGGGGGAK